MADSAFVGVDFVVVAAFVGLPGDPDITKALSTTNGVGRVSWGWSAYLVTEEVDLGEPFISNMPQRIGLVPPCSHATQNPTNNIIYQRSVLQFQSLPPRSALTSRENIETNLPPNRVRKAQMRKLLFQRLNKLGSAAGLLVPLFKVDTLLGAEGSKGREDEGSVGS